jgi:hypothetical protein
VDDNQLLGIKDRAWDRLRRIPGVHAVGIGVKTVAGRRDNRPALVVFVESKKELAQLQPDEIVPATIERVPTDVVEMRMPRLLGGPLPLTATVAATAGGAKIKFRATVDPTPLGYVIVTSITLTRLATPTVPAQVFRFSHSVYSNGVIPLDKLIDSVSTSFQHGSVNDPESNVAGTHIKGSPEVSLAADPGWSVVASCIVLETDRTQYSKEYLRGGAQIQEPLKNEIGTLGLLATTTDPAGSVVAITNQHVVAVRTRSATTLSGRVNATSTEITMFTVHGDPITNDSVVIVEFYDDKDLIGNALCTTVAGDTLDTIASKVADAINGAFIPQVSAKATNERISIFGAKTADAVVCNTLGPGNDPPQSLLVFVSKPAVLTNVLTFHATSAKLKNGLYVSIHPGGTSPSFGVFVDTQGLTLNGIAKQLFTKITDLPLGVRGRAVAKDPASRPTLEITGAELVECLVHPDLRIGQPTNCFTWPCSQQIGKVIASRLDVDAAVIQLDPGLKYKLQIQGIGSVSGVTPPLMDMQVQKRGCITGLTQGQIVAVATSGSTLAGDPPVFKRSYTNGIVVSSRTTDDGGTTRRPFCSSGDSGSAVLTSGSGPVKVVGLLFGGGDDTFGLATPIQAVLDAFPKLGLSFSVKAGEDPDAVRTVPAPVVQFQTIAGEDAPRISRADAAPAHSGWAGLQDRLREVESEIRGTTGGREYVNVFQSHFAEAQTLVRSNRRVATVWRRSGGPEILSKLLEMAYSREQRIPTEINGKSFGDCLERIGKILLQYASPALSADLRRLSPGIAAWSGKTYSELLSAFQQPLNE